MEIKELQPEIRRAVMIHASRERITFDDALVFLLLEGIKARHILVGKPVHKRREKSVR